MPIYEYRCKKCSAVNEFIVPAGSSESFTCTACGSRALEKMLSVTNVHSKTVTTCGSVESCSMASPCGGGSCAAPGCCPKQ